MLIGQILYGTTRRWPDRIAVVERENSLSYSQWNAKVNSVAQSLVGRLKVRKGDRVGIMAYNSIEQITTAMALQKIDAVYVSLNFRLSIDELRYQIEDSGLKVLFFDAELADTVLPCADIVQTLVAIKLARSLPSD